MDHYSLEIMARLHQKELVEQELREQAAQRQNLGSRPANHLKQKLVIGLSLLLSIYWLFA